MDDREENRSNPERERKEVMKRFVQLLAVCLPLAVSCAATRTNTVVHSGVTVFEAQSWPITDLASVRFWWAPTNLPFSSASVVTTMPAGVSAPTQYQRTVHTVGVPAGAPAPVVWWYVTLIDAGGNESAPTRATLPDKLSGPGAPLFLEQRK